MKKIKLLSFLFLIIISISTFLFIKNNNVSASHHTITKDLSDIENAIIIMGIEKGESDFQNDNKKNNRNGLIIYDDSFNIINLNNNSRNVSIIKKLQRQDRKWHLTSHRIKKGENLWSLAKQFNTDYKLIISINEITDPDRLNHGNLILIPNRNGLNHRVAASETISQLEKKYGVKKDSIIFSNRIKNNIIKEDEILFIPDGVDTEKNKANITKSKNLKNNAFTETDEESITIKEYQKKIDLKFIWPLKGKITSAFGKRKISLNNKTKFHCGLDIAADIGSPIKASAEGEAIFSGWKKAYGRVIILKHAEGYITVYAHNEKNLIKAGDFVKTGDIIAMSGNSGAVTGPHLHFEIRKYLAPLNPLRFLE